MLIDPAPFQVVELDSDPLIAAHLARSRLIDAFAQTEIMLSRWLEKYDYQPFKSRVAEVKSSQRYSTLADNERARIDAITHDLMELYDLRCQLAHATLAIFAGRDGDDLHATNPQGQARWYHRPLVISMSELKRASNRVRNLGEQLTKRLNPPEPRPPLPRAAGGP